MKNRNGPCFPPHAPWRAAHIPALLDLTDLRETCTDDDVDALCARADTAFGPVAGVCVYPCFVPRARQTLARSGMTDVSVVTVANFPAGNADTARAVEDVINAQNLGADEVDLVLPHAAFLHGDRGRVEALLRACRNACSARLKIILETGVLAEDTVIRAACRLCLDCGADFLKTSTGKSAVHATLPAARVMLECLAAHGGQTGIKISGGLRTVAQALPYLDLATEILGANRISPRTFRFGASSLLNDVERVAADQDRACDAPA